MNYILPTPTNGPASWDRQPGEPPRAAVAFDTYLAQGPSRSLDKVAEALYPDTIGIKRALGKRPTSTHLRNWSRQYNWVQRAKSWDAHLAMELRQVEMSAIADMRERHAELSRQMLAVGLSKLQQALDDDRPWSLDQIRRWIIDGIRAEREAMALLSEGAVEDCLPIEKMSLQQRQELYYRLVNEQSGESVR